MADTPYRSRHVHIRMPETLYQRLLRASSGSDTGETVSDIARAGIARELKLREKRAGG